MQTNSDHRPKPTPWLRSAGAVAALAAALAIAACSPAEDADESAGAADGPPVAETGYGPVRGIAHDGILAFKGIPYGASTAGDNRFRAPRPPAAWTEPRDATEYGNRCPQVDLVGDTVSDYGRLIGWDRQPGELSEDCLVLNVWTPALDDARRPVMVSFHGGGFTSGTGNSAGYDGDPLARFGDVVVVTLNHRLGALGYTHLAELGGEDLAESGNAGMLDLVAALEWVRDNIAGFGGDPDTVMIWGQSGGGAKTTTLLAMPAADGLFHRAAVQSGSSLRMREPGAATEAARALMAELGLEPGQLDELRSLPFEDIVAAQAAVAPGATFAPVVDGDVLPRHPFDPDAPEISADIPMIIGWTLDDSAIGLTNFDLEEAGLEKAMARFTGDEAAPAVAAAYRAAYPDATPYLVQARAATDARFGRGALAQAARKARQEGAPAWLYLWEWESPGMGGKFGAVHGVDVGLAFHNFAGEITGGGTEEGRRMADQLASAWVAFARTGDPNNDRLPNWPAYDPETMPTMIFGDETRVEEDPLRDLRGFWEDEGVR